MMENRLSPRVRGIAPSATMSIDAKTKNLIKEGKPVINMSVGEPDFDTPMEPAYAGIRAIVSGNTRYTAAAGTLELRQAIARKLMTENGLQYSPEQLIVSNGAKHSLFNIFLSICEPGDEVILPAPYWVSYPEQIRLAGATPVIVECDESTGFKMTAKQLAAAITPKTKAVMLNSPNNPTGAVYHEEELRALGAILVQHDVFLVTDEIYERLVYDVEHISLPKLYPDLMNRSLVVNGFSKAFAMTGWRLGYAAAPVDVAKAMNSLQSHGTGSPSTITQAAGVVALDSFHPEMVAEFKHRRDYLVAELQSIPGLQCLVPDGAFYVFPNVSQVFGQTYKGRTVTNAITYCEILLEEHFVAAVPGEAFGSPNNIRISYATSFEEIQTAVDRIRAFHSLIEV